jgi:putative nucleotidyltransferase with HDIG domain
MDIKPLLETKNKDVLVTEGALSTSGEILINRDGMDKYKSYLKGSVKQLASAMSAQQAKNLVVKETTKMLMKELMDNPRSGEKIKESEKAVEDIIDSIVNSKGIVSNLITINKHDYYTYTHCVNVSVFSVGTAMALGIKGEAELFAIGVGGLLHDIGKSTIPPEILNKHPERLNTFESSILREHVMEGVNLVKLFKGIPADALYLLKEHHEKLSGSGYPAGIKGDKMHLSGKIAAIVNLYDTLTTSRPNYRAMTPFETLSLMRSLVDDYDQDIFKEFVNLLGKSL